MKKLFRSFAVLFALLVTFTSVAFAMPLKFVPTPDQITAVQAALMGLVIYGVTAGLKKRSRYFLVKAASGLPGCQQ